MWMTSLKFGMYIIQVPLQGNPKDILFKFLATTNNMAEIQTKMLI